jgi:hypothetical protein
MTIQTLDQIFPFVVFGYGAIVSLALHLPQLEKIAEQRFTQEIYQQMKTHRVLALVCLVIGALWSLQNIWAGAGPLFSFGPL